jgi:hypothetical protein
MNRQAIPQLIIIVKLIGIFEVNSSDGYFRFVNKILEIATPVTKIKIRRAITRVAIEGIIR